MAKAELALGDAALVACHQYHWSCRERNRRIQQLQPPDGFPQFQAVRQRHGHGAEFKLHPMHSTASREALWGPFQDLVSLAREVWLWLESHRLNVTFPDPLAYATHPEATCRSGSAMRHWLHNVHRFKGGSWTDKHSRRYPRERLMRALGLLLWERGNCESNPRLSQLQRALGSRAATWTDLVAAYKEVWPSYG